VANPEDIKVSINYLENQIADSKVRLAELKEALRKANIPNRPVDGTAFEVIVKFTTSPHRYRFLFIHVPGKGYYSTGTLPENQFFATWEKLWAYLDSDEVESRTALMYVRGFAPVRGVPVKTGWS
jgi:hypothetical protein